MSTSSVRDTRKILRERLHLRYKIREFDNTDVWAGNMHVECGGDTHEGHITRLYLDTAPGAAPLKVKISIELYVRDVTDAAPLPEDGLDAVLWTDADRLGFINGGGMYQTDPGRNFTMSLLRDSAGNVLRRGNNAVFVSPEIEIGKTGAFSYTVLFSADGKKRDDPGKSWIYSNDIALNKDRVLVVIPASVLDCPSFMEICVRKYGARVEKKKFFSGKLKNVTDDLENIPADVLYLLPIFEPGTKDILTGEDVRKGELGSIYAVKDFFRLDPDLATPPEEADPARLVAGGFVAREDLDELLDGENRRRIGTPAQLAALGNGAEFFRAAGRRAACEIIARAELRELTAKAHALGKKVIFDLVIMQTSRDSDLILKHREWYALDETGAPKRHKIAWLDYSDVALFDLTHNRPLQNYLGSVAPFWMERCGLDGVRIDASQTVHASFLKQVKNRICLVKQDAIVLGETLCPFSEAVEVPSDLIYSLFVDHHVNLSEAQPYYDLLEEYHRTFPAETRAVAYFENHDSARAGAKWRARFLELLKSDKTAAARWNEMTGRSLYRTADVMTALKNLQCSLINTLSGAAGGVNFCRTIENGTDFMETTRTDFESATALDFSLRGREPNSLLHGAYMRLNDLKDDLRLVRTGRVFYLRDNLAPRAPDRVFALLRYDASSRLLFLANLDPVEPRPARFSFSGIPLDPKTKYRLSPLFDSYAELKMPPLRTQPELSGRFLSEGLAEFELQPLQSVLIVF